MAIGLYVKKMLKHLPQGTSFVMASAQVVVMNDDDKFLITKRADNGLWDFPGGGCEETDTYKQTAVKEMNEEINLNITEDDLEFLGVMSDSKFTTMYYPNDGVTKYYATVFGVVVGKFTPKFNDEENVEYAFVSLEDALTYNLVPGSRYIAEQLMANNIPFIN